MQHGEHLDFAADDSVRHDEWGARDDQLAGACDATCSAALGKLAQAVDRFTESLGDLSSGSWIVERDVIPRRIEISSSLACVSDNHRQRA
nr:hypothetical protein [Sabulicella rubraurantiaca]